MDVVIKDFVNASFRLLSKADENIFQSAVNTNRTTDQQGQESSTSAIIDVRRFFSGECLIED